MSYALRRILLGLSGGQYDSQTALFVFGLAALPGAKVVCRLIRPMKDDPEVLMASGFTGAAFRHFIDSAERTAMELDAVARLALAQAHERHAGVSFDYRLPSSGDSYEFASQGWGADLVILAHPALMQLQYYRLVVEEAIIHSGRPVLLLPEVLPRDLLANVVFCWRYDSASAAAMAITLPLLRAAGKLTIISLRDSDDREEAVAEPLEYLQAHGVAVDHVLVDLVPRHADQAIDGYCAAIGASLLIVGGVMDSDLEDYVMTGAVRRVKGKPQRPVLIIG